MHSPYAEWIFLAEYSGPRGTSNGGSGIVLSGGCRDALGTRTVRDMTTSVGRGAIDQPAPAAGERIVRAHPAARLVARVAGSLWLRDRAVAELRWASVTLAAMAVLALVGKVLDPADDGFDRAIVLVTPLAIVTGALAWSPAASRVMALPYARILLGPAVVLLAVV